MGFDLNIYSLCPPFYRGEEMTSDVLDSDCFMGYHFKNHFKTQQALIVFLMKDAYFYLK